MRIQNSIAQRLWNRIARAQKKVQQLMVKKADELRISLLTIDMMVVIRENEKVAIANILPQIRPVPGQLHDFALLYLDLPETILASGFYRLQLAYDVANPAAAQAVLVDEAGQFVKNVDYYLVDIFAPVSGTKEVPVKKLSIFETFNKTNKSYAIGGTHANGQAFVVVLDL
jgi:hypothetical protein